MPGEEISKLTADCWFPGTSGRTPVAWEQEVSITVGADAPAALGPFWTFRIPRRSPDLALQVAADSGCHFGGARVVGVVERIESRVSQARHRPGNAAQQDHAVVVGD